MNKFIITLIYPCLILSRTTQLTVAADAFFNFLLTVFLSDRDKVFASETLFLSTICAIITVPLVILLVK
jgi:predicted permease